MQTLKAAFTSRPLAIARSRRSLTVRAGEPGVINPSIRKEEEKVVDFVVATKLEKPQVAYCRCWRSKTFPLCDGAHVRHNDLFKDNVGPLVIKKEEK